ncbi:MAG TPA: AbrB/MazE/SpoVT family DNA-binding domain-containing protein [Acidimicrobiia bacterium]
MTTTRLASNGRIVIPSMIRDSLNLTTGDEFEVRVEAGEIRLTPLAGVVEFIQEYLAKEATGRSLVDELIEERRLET